MIDVSGEVANVDAGKRNKRNEYRVEYSLNGRVKCKGPAPCAGSFILEGELRIGTAVKFQDMTSYAWRHWACLTDKMKENMRKSCGSASGVDGYEDLLPADQQRIAAVWEIHEDSEVEDVSKTLDETHI